MHYWSRHNAPDDLRPLYIRALIMYQEFQTQSKKCREMNWSSWKSGHSLNWPVPLLIRAPPRWLMLGRIQGGGGGEEEGPTNDLLGINSPPSPHPNPKLWRMTRRSGESISASNIQKVPFQNLSKVHEQKISRHSLSHSHDCWRGGRWIQRTSPPSTPEHSLASIGDIVHV